jgi:hypothetical protein
MHHTQTHIFLPRKKKKNKERGKFNPGKKKKKNVSSLLLLEGKRNSSTEQNRHNKTSGEDLMMNGALNAGLGLAGVCV